MADALTRQAQARPKAVAIEAGGIKWSYEELDAHATTLARHLADAGAQPGSTVAALVPNGPQVGAVVHGVPRTGAGLAMLHPGWSDRELVNVLARLRPRLVLCNQETETQASRVVQQAPIASLDHTQGTRALTLEQLPASDEPLPGVSAGSTHTIVATSGTTGQPNLAQFTDQGHQAHAQATMDHLALSPEDRWLSVLSPAHIGGLALWLRAAVVGSTVIPRPRFEPGPVLHAIKQARITHTSLVPVMLERLLDASEGEQAPGSLELVLLGGAATPAPLLERALEAGWPVAVTYGQTEAASQLATAPPELTRAKPGTAGPALAGVDLAISDEGEILARSPALTTGYLGEASAPIDEDGWLHTGDLGRLDEAGHLWVTGRLSQRIVTGGVTVDPVEIEAVLAEHPAVRQAAVVGLPDPEWGQRVVAAVVTEPAVAEAELTQHCRELLSKAKLPRGFVFVEALPRNANGKVDRAAVRAVFDG